MLTVAPGCHGLVQPPGARMILTGPGRDERYMVGSGLLDDPTGQDTRAVDQGR